ncbi:ArsR/SmtB family transcription factor [Methylopila musalis]|uniref:ArsR/SmtB family transcription factor n=1 Tax=Methylopila musalis TaxID=1134781 RepID=A0ABW3Z6P7_9HYPH
MTQPTAQQIDGAAAIFKALADPARLAILIRLADAERSVSELAAIGSDRIGTVSARLQVLFNARLLTRRREGQTILYGLADRHVAALVANAVEHACEDHRTGDDPHG